MHAAVSAMWVWSLWRLSFCASSVACIDAVCVWSEAVPDKPQLLRITRIVKLISVKRCAYGVGVWVGSVAAAELRWRNLRWWQIRLATMHSSCFVSHLSLNQISNGTDYDSQVFHFVRKWTSGTYPRNDEEQLCWLLPQITTHRQDGTFASDNKLFVMT